MVIQRTLTTKENTSEKEESGIIYNFKVKVHWNFNAQSSVTSYKEDVLINNGLLGLSLYPVAEYCDSLIRTLPC